MEKVMKINKKLKKSAQILIQIGVVFAGGMAFADPTLPANDAYDLFVGPNQTGGPLPPRTPNIGYFYTNLSRRLDNSPIKVNRLILGAVSPISDANFSPFTSDNGTFLNFLTLQLPSPSHQIFLMPDAETDTPTLWTQWSTDTSVQPTVPEKIAVWRAESKTGGGPCNFNSASPDIAYPINDPKTNITAPVAEEMMMTVCWATIMNYSAGGASPLISGLVYDGESNIVQTTPENLSWFKQELNYYHQLDPKVPNLLGWIHGGVSPNVDISFVEMYDRMGDGGNAVTEISPQVSYKFFNPSEAQNCTTLGHNQYCDTTATKLFPGIQYQEEAQSSKGGAWSLMGAEGASIATCALDPTDLICNTYQANVDTSQSIDNQILQSYLYIFKGLSRSQAFTNLSALNTSPPTPDPATKITNPQVVYVFSTQYFGPDKAANFAPPPNKCVLDEVVPGSQCGIEDGFGAWDEAAYLQNFKNLTHQFLYYVQGCTSDTDGSCKFDGQAAIYMYDFIPLNWYSDEN